MILTETRLEGAFIIEPDRIEDERGFFIRQWCKREFEIRGLMPDFVGCNISFSKRKGTLRGLHYQLPPHEEAKLIRCVKGAIYDVIIDLRPQSPTYKEWLGMELSADSYKMLYVPKGFAHGFQVLEDETEVLYPVSQFYQPEYERGVRWDDPAFGIQWPQPEKRILSQKDRSWPNYAM